MEYFILLVFPPRLGFIWVFLGRAEGEGEMPLLGKMDVFEAKESSKMVFDEQ